MSSVPSESTGLPFGMIAGLGVGAGVFYYRSLVNAHLQQGLALRLCMVHADVRKVLTLANARATRQLADYLAGLLGQLAKAGAAIATIPAFAPQVCAQELAEITPIPLIGLLDAIVDEVKRRELRRVAIFGSRVTMETGLFGTLKNVAEIIPLNESKIDQISRIYGNIVENERASAEELNTLRSFAHTLVDQEHADAILLAGTDLAFVFSPENTDFPCLDGARTHIEAIMKIVSPIANLRP